MNFIVPLRDLGVQNFEALKLILNAWKMLELTMPICKIKNLFFNSGPVPPLALALPMPVDAHFTFIINHSTYLLSATKLYLFVWKL